MKLLAVIFVLADIYLGYTILTNNSAMDACRERHSFDICMTIFNN